uniref:GLOBIN domain-containing protein n=1 Tax=Elaeophora elaphi TaxID=1147741 RepID=A0A0R3RV23_9BILA
MHEDLDSPSSSFRRDKPSRKPAILVTNMNNDLTEPEDDFNSEVDELQSSTLSPNCKQTVASSQLSTSFPSEHGSFVTTISDESSVVPSSSSICSYPQGDSALEDTKEQTKDHGQSLAHASVSWHETEKEKWDEKKKKSLQNFRLYSIQYVYDKYDSANKLQVDHSLHRHRSTETLPSLTPAQIHLIRNIWRQVYITKGPTVIGSTLLHGIFFKSKKNKEYFLRCPFPHRFPNRDSFNKAHAKAVGEMLDKIVDNLENLESIYVYLFFIGATHANLARGQVSKEIWNVMAEAFIDCTLDWGDKKGRTETSRKAWALIIASVIEKIKEGHLHERRQLAYHRRSSIATPHQTATAVTSLPSSAPTIRFWKSVEEPDPNVQMF